MDRETFIEDQKKRAIAFWDRDDDHFNTRCTGMLKDDKGEWLIIEWEYQTDIRKVVAAATAGTTGRKHWFLNFNNKGVDNV